MPRIREILHPLSRKGFASKTFFGTEVYRRETSEEESIIFPHEKHISSDEVNKRDQDNELTIHFEGRLFVPLNGFFDYLGDGYSLVWRAEDYCPPSFFQSLQHAAGIRDLIPSIGEVATSTLARSNPSKPDISVPNFLYELKDLPGMIRDIGRLKLLPAKIRKQGFRGIPKDSANWFLSYQMGWKPLIKDLSQMLMFQSLVDKRIRELHGLYNNGGLQRRVRSPEWKASLEQVYNENLYMDSFLTSLTVKHSVYSNIERWGTVRWIPANLPDKRYSSAEMARLARRLVFGLNGISAKQLWDAIPWTWMIGWFSNAGEFLQAHSNTIPLVHSTPCVMTKTESKTSWTRNQPESVENWFGGYGDAGHTTKERTVSPGSLSATIPFLNRRQLSILGALAIQRRR